MAKDLIIWGAGGHARVVTVAVYKEDVFWICGYLDDVHPEMHGTDFMHHRIRGGKEKLDSLRRDDFRYMFIAIGDNEARMRLAKTSREHGFELAIIVHPHAIATERRGIGGGTVIMAGAVIQPGCTIGENVIINTSATVDHECIIEDGVHIAPGAHLAGRVTVECGTLIGIGAVVITGVQIGTGSIIGAGAVVLRDVPSGVVCYGNPARVVRDR